MAGDTNVKIAYGLDLAGYTTGKSALARVERECGSRIVHAIVFTNHPFSKKRVGAHKLCIEPEVDAIQCILRTGGLYVDVPIDLQDLTKPDPTFIWQLTRRPVDHAFHGLAPLADRIGSPVARFRKILSTLSIDPLGDGLWETYPRATISLLGGFEECRNKKGSLTYKDGRAKRNDGEWIPCLMRKGRDAADKAVACMATEIGITTSDGTTINDDELDAVICALTGVAPKSALLCGDELEKEILCRINADPSQKTGFGGPTGYVLLRRRFWSEIPLDKNKMERRI